MLLLFPLKGQKATEFRSDGPYICLVHASSFYSKASRSGKRFRLFLGKDVVVVHKGPLDDRRHLDEKRDRTATSVLRVSRIDRLPHCAVFYPHNVYGEIMTHWIDVDASNKRTVALVVARRMANETRYFLCTYNGTSAALMIFTCCRGKVEKIAVAFSLSW